ncbi:MAG TPA: 6-carboxytetrahydropterin synthase, partial [Nitrososphaerales archaeon]|nr:6-carboxytetrahydropterin synthase [Nitrososphaerales archaeon]
MTEALVERLSPRLRELGRGAYLKEYRRGSRKYRSSLHAAVSDILGAIEGPLKESVPVPGTKLLADFEAHGVLIFVDRELNRADVERLGRTGRKCVLIRTSPLRSDRHDSGIRVIELGSKDGTDLQMIFLDDPSFNFDYAHILPHTQKCSVMHGHTSSVLVEVVGSTMDGMVVDFGAAKEIIRDAVRALDHKLFIDRKYVVKEDAKSVTLRFRTVHGPFAIQAPKATTVLLEGEATVENLAKEVLGRISTRMPENVTAVGV